MGTISPKELLNFWAREQMPVEMAMGHVLQNLVYLYEENKKIKSALRKLQADVNTPKFDANPKSSTRSKR